MGRLLPEMRLLQLSRRYFVLFSAPAVLALTLTTQGVAQTVMVSNLTETSNGTVPVSYRPPDFEDSASRYSAAASFTTGTAATSLANVTINLGGGSGSDFSVSLYSNTNNNPGSLLATLSGPTAPTTSGHFVYTPTSLLALAANTTYWWVASVPVSSSTISFNIRSTASTAETSSTGWTIGDTWRQQPISGAYNSATGPLMFSVAASAIPEPSTYAALAGLVALGFAVYRRKRAA